MRMARCRDRMNWPSNRLFFKPVPRLQLGGLEIYTHRPTAAASCAAQEGSGAAPHP